MKGKKRRNSANGISFGSALHSVNGRAYQDALYQLQVDYFYELMKRDEFRKLSNEYALRFYKLMVKLMEESLK